jgi:hypothetical protein
MIGRGVSLIRFLSAFDSIDGDLVAFQRKEDAMGAYPESVAIAFGLQFLHVTLEILAHQLLLRTLSYCWRGLPAH